MFTCSKRQIPDPILKTIFQNHLRDHYHSLILYTDGSHSQHGAAYAVHSRDEPIQRRILPIASIYTAELLAIKDTLEYASVQQEIHSCVIVTDSRSAIQAIHSLDTKHPVVNHIRDIIITVRFHISLCWAPSHVGIPGNERVNALAWEAAETLPITPLKIPRSDFRSYIRSCLGNTWKSSWPHGREPNELREHMPEIASKYVCIPSRSWSVILTRLRIGHTRFSHGWLLRGDPRPYYHDCIVPLTVRHILLECPTFGQERHLFGCSGSSTMAWALQMDNCRENGPLFNYLNCIDMLHTI